ncbi:AAA family ATPase [Thomasclavelia cocleata]|uniref:cytidylate kinase-like family protein n=1 Tax=Thomasclavelia cocleata TaxID=69824 RepID=UPI002012DD35|nr:cytidylate kinase-like family protein [Thomasclavelia cocleata]
MIAQKVAEKLGIVYYDNEVIDLAAKEMGFDVDVIRKVSEEKSSGFMYSLSSSAFTLPLNDQVYTMQSKIIRHLASYDACIIVSGCADYILEDFDNVLKVFIHAPLESRIRRVKEDYKENHSDLKKYVVKKDKTRSNYYNYYTTKKWGQLKNFDLTINSDLGINEAADIISKLYLEGKF